MRIMSSKLSCRSWGVQAAPLNIRSEMVHRATARLPASMAFIYRAADSISTASMPMSVHFFIHSSE